MQTQKQHKTTINGAISHTTKAPPTMTTATPELLLESFPHHNLPKIEGQPAHNQIANLKKLLAANAASVPTELGGGNQGCLALILGDAVHNAISGTPFIVPIYPGATAIAPANASAAVQDQRNREHREALRQWRKCNNMQNALKKQLILRSRPHPLTCHQGQTC